MPAYTLTSFRIRPPGGRTGVRRRLHKFQTGTVDRLSSVAVDVGTEATEELRARLRQAFHSPDSTGRTAASAKFSVKTDRQKGVGLSIYIGAFRQVRFMTNLAGGRWHSGPYRIWASNKKYLTFYWRRESTRFWGRYVRHPGFPAGDIPMEVMLKYRDIFTRRSMEAVTRGIVELTAGSEARATLKPIRSSYKR